MKYLFDVVKINNKILVRCLKKRWLGGYEIYYSTGYGGIDYKFNQEFTESLSEAHGFTLEYAKKRVHSYLDYYYPNDVEILYSPYEPKQEEFV